MREAKFYAVGNKEILYANCPDEAVNEFLEENWTDDSPGDMPEFVEVQGYAPKVVSENSKAFKWCIDTLIESLDEAYGGDNPSDYQPSEEAMKKLKGFIDAVISEYPVWQCEPVGSPEKMAIQPFINQE